MNIQNDLTKTIPENTPIKLIAERNQQEIGVYESIKQIPDCFTTMQVRKIEPNWDKKQMDITIIM